MMRQKETVNLPRSRPARLLRTLLTSLLFAALVLSIAVTAETQATPEASFVVVVSALNPTQEMTRKEVDRMFLKKTRIPITSKKMLGSTITLLWVVPQFISEVRMLVGDSVDPNGIEQFGEGGVSQFIFFSVRCPMISSIVKACLVPCLQRVYLVFRHTFELLTDQKKV